MYKQILIAGTLAACFACGQAQPSPPAKGEAGATAKVQVLSAAQMSKDDADVVAANRNAIASAAEVNGYDLGSGSWIRNQVVCPDASRHVLMHYLQINRDGSVSLFTAAVPRSPGATNLRVRIVPVLYHGAQAFHVFGSSPSQRELINEVVTAKPYAGPGKDDFDWTTIAYCYAALAGAEPASKSVTSPEVGTPILQVSQEGDLRELHFSAVGPEHLTQDWRIVFDRQAQVKGIFLSTKAQNSQQTIPAAQQSQGKPLPQPKNRSDRTIPAAQQPEGKPIPPQR